MAAASMSGLATTTLGQVALTVGDVARSTAFYRDVVGLPFLFGAGQRLSFFGIGGTRLMLSAGEGEFTPGSGTVLYLKVDDIIATHAELAARGVAFVDTPHLVAPMPDHDLWMCFFRDPDQHLWALMAELPKSVGGED